MVNIAVIGIGNRAGKYLSCLPQDARVAFLVDSDPIRLTQAAERYRVPQSACFSDTASFFSEKRAVDGIIIATPDQLHFSETLSAIRAGYPVLVEKPAASTQEELDSMLEASKQTGIPVSVCLVMRYHPYFRRIKEIVDSGEIGQVLSIDHTEAIGPDRMGHTFVRGLWSRKDLSGPIFLSKCSHDTDFLLWLTGGKALEVTSEGGLTRFRPDCAPPQAARRCLDCSVDCPYSAVRLYRDQHAWVAGFDVPEGKTLDDVIEEELVAGRYGRCVYHCDNDVNDIQEVRVLLDNGIRLTMRLDGVSLDEGRRTIIQGSKGKLRALGTTLEVNGRVEDYSSLLDLPLHAGADRFLIEDFIDSLRTGHPTAVPLSVTREAHRICFLAR
ncbi:MAG: Gfo/Idh/MocA family oxidoreductase [Bacteroidales bacterium]|nr:Gfo/Idh/MocA family oxidoreductase [Bacteroidales bacterium]